MDMLGAIAMLRRRWLAIVLCFVAGVGGGYYLGHHGDKTYRATAETLIVAPQVNNVQDQLIGTQLSANLVETYSRLISSQVLLRHADSVLESEGVTTGATGLSATTISNTYLVDISASSTSPQIAELTANAGAQALQTTVAELQKGLISKIAVTITSPAVLPTTPVSPRPRLDLLLGLILGLVAGLGAAALLEALDQTIKTTSEAGAAVGVSLIGLVPKRRGDVVVVTADDSSPKGEPYRSIRTSIRFLDPDRPLRSLLITSPTPGDGKTVTATNLAVAFALSGDQVVVIDADLRRPKLADSFGLEGSVGLTSIVLRATDLETALQTWSPRLSLLASGPLPPNPSEILGSQLVSNLLRDVVDHADITIIDAPPVLPVADALALATQVDGVILVLRADETLKQAAAEAARRLEAVGANVLGYVLNGVPRAESKSTYASYGYYPRPTPPRKPAAQPSGSGSSVATPNGAETVLPFIEGRAPTPKTSGALTRRRGRMQSPDPNAR